MSVMSIENEIVHSTRAWYGGIDRGKHKLLKMIIDKLKM